MEAIAAAAAAAVSSSSSGSSKQQKLQQQQQQQEQQQQQQQQQRQQRWRFDIAGDTPPVLGETTLARGGRWLRFPFDDANKKTNQYYISSKQFKNQKPQ